LAKGFLENIFLGGETDGKSEVSLAGKEFADGVFFLLLP